MGQLSSERVGEEAVSTYAAELGVRRALSGTAAGGTIANLIFGVLSWAVARRFTKSPSWRYFFLQLMTFNLFDAGGYFLFSGVGNIGDWAAVVAGWHPAWAWRVARRLDCTRDGHLFPVVCTAMPT